MKNSGKTPLLRARNIEKKLKVKRIYIKLEGANPSGSKHDRFAQKIIFSALAQDKDTIVAEGSKPYMLALSYYAKIYGIQLKVFEFKNQKWKSKLSETFLVMNHQTKTKPKGRVFYDQLSLKDNEYLAVENYNHLGIAEHAYTHIAKEIIDKMKRSADTIFYTHPEDYKNSLYNAYLNNYIDNHMNLPEFNAISYDDYNREELTDDIIKEAHALLARYEHLNVKKKEVLPFALFLYRYKNGDLNGGEHVIIIDQAKTRVKIRRLESFDDFSKEELLSYVDHYLDVYSDPIEDAKDALENAIDKGFILIASRDDQVDGVCVVVNMGFNQFIPTYHLAYIGTNPKSKGRGLGTELIEYAVDLADGKLSLHVDLDNNRAKKLYEKMGFKHVYNRMIFQNEE
ncbi:MAG TPA: pyridoxal-phosphate dependent enzyme [Candidatus Izemoplasmatales bacterium]|nr:pyridoxal-phosphate dependent enzyme [Candidatus Izemoplasmatales bacterium]